jgi:hypothetical protein
MRSLPYSLPPGFMNRKELTGHHSIPLADFKQLTRKINQELEKSGAGIIDLEPGDKFQPSYLDIPSRPDADFLWASCGSVLISERIRILFEECTIKGVAFCRVTPGKIGKKSAKHKSPIPSTGEPEDMIDEVPLLANTHDIYSLWH